MGPPETIVGWTVFLGLAAVGAVLGIAGRLRLGEAVTVGILAIPAGLAVGGTIDSVRNSWGGPLRYAAPAALVACVGYTVLAIGVSRNRAHVAARERPRSIAAGWGVLAATAATTVIAVVEAKSIAVRGAPIWVAPTLTGSATFLVGSFVVHRSRRRERARKSLPSPPSAVNARTAIGIVLGMVIFPLFLSMSVAALVALIALPFVIAFMWFAARNASAPGRLLLALLAAFDLWPLSGYVVSLVVSPDGEVVITGAVFACWAAFVFWLSAQRSSLKRPILTIEEVRHGR